MYVCVCVCAFVRACRNARMRRCMVYVCVWCVMCVTHACVLACMRTCNACIRCNVMWFGVVCLCKVARVYAAYGCMRGCACIGSSSVYIRICVFDAICAGIYGMFVCLHVCMHACMDAWVHVLM